MTRSWSVPLWLVLTVGGVAGVAVSRPFRVVIRDVAGNMAPEARPDISFPDGMGWEEFVFAYASVIAMPILIWVVVNLIYARSLGLPRYGHNPQSVKQTEQTDAEVKTGPPEFTKRLTLGPDAEIWALQAEDHYLRVYSGKREELIRYRFSDAVNEVRGLPGLQVHRSFWVNTDAIDSIKQAGRSYEIVLKSGLTIPVSRSYRYAVRDAGLLTKFPSRPSPLFVNDGASPSETERSQGI